jgi:hypothetical protein
MNYLWLQSNTTYEPVKRSACAAIFLVSETEKREFGKYVLFNRVD